MAAPSTARSMVGAGRIRHRVHSGGAGANLEEIAGVFRAKQRSGTCFRLRALGIMWAASRNWGRIPQMTVPFEKQSARWGWLIWSCSCFHKFQGSLVQSPDAFVFSVQLCLLPCCSSRVTAIRASRKNYPSRSSVSEEGPERTV